MATPIPTNEATFTARAIAGATRATHATFRGVDHTVVGVTTDSRAVRPGCAFVALRGERFDGHAFLADAVRGGARVVVVEEGRGGGVDVDVVEVKDTLVAWGDLARAHMHSWRHASHGGRVVAITGSAGKTTTKELTHALLSTWGECHFTAGNLNNRIGLPAVALGVESRHRFAVFELGMSVPGEIAAMARIVEPEVAVITNVGIAHAEGAGGTREAVGREKGAIFEALALAPAAVAVVNADDEVAMAQIALAGSARVETFGRSPKATYCLLERVPRGMHGSRVRIGRPAGDVIELDFPLIGEAGAMDLLAALAAAEAAAQSPLALDRAGGALASFASRAALAGRGGVKVLPCGALVIDDTYNANPASMRAALVSLQEVAVPDRRRMIVVLGEMKELGPLADAEHASLGAALAKIGVALAISCGGLMDLAMDAAAAAGVRTIKAASTDEAARIAATEVKPGDAVLVKGSRSVGTEKVVAALAARSPA
jgi:UDP-N-acetylmuramoyl-tripeptide--D-alanyl-D-alanine ligase